MAVAVPQPNRMAWRHAIELGGRRQPLEAGVVESLGTHPRSGREPRCRAAHGREHRGHRIERCEVQVGGTGRERVEVEVRIEEAGHDRRAAHVDPLGAGPGEGSHLGAAAHGHHPPITHRDRLRHRAAGVEGQHPCPFDEPVGARQSEDGSGFASFTFIS